LLKILSDWEKFSENLRGLKNFLIHPV